MEVRKLAAFLCVAASCAGCVTESKTVPVPPETLASLKGVKEQEFAKREGQPHTWVAQGQVRESQAAQMPEGSAMQVTCREEARKAYQKAVEIDPKCAEGYIALANLYQKQDDCDRALVVFRKGLEQNPKSTNLWFETGMCCASKKDFPRAIQCLTKAHELDPENSHIAMFYGYCLARAGKGQEAVTALASVMNRADANYQVARMMDHLERPELTRQYLNAALRERPTHAGSLEMLAQLDTPPGQTGHAVATIGHPELQQASYSTKE